MKSLLEKILAFFTKAILKKYRPKVIGITGSVGKSSTKDAIYTVLKNDFAVRKNAKNYNNEIGLPITVIGTETGGRSVVKWSGVFLKAIGLLIFKDNAYPEILILEMGADRPGDIEYLVKLVPCTIGVVTRIAPAHVEFFGSLDKIAKEKRKIVSHLDKSDFAILNFDDSRVKEMSKVTKASIISFGYAPEADVRALELEAQGEGLALEGLKFKINYHGSSVPVFVPDVIGMHQTYAVLAAATVGLSLGLNLVDISERIRRYKAPKGRMKVISGLKNSLIIDDTYNASPASAKAAIQTVVDLSQTYHGRKIAVIGDMLELGDMSKQSHFELGKQIAELGYDRLIAVGSFADYQARGAKQAGLEEIKIFKNSAQAAGYVLENLQKNDLILVKGSQGVRMEKVVKAIMSEPQNAGKLLVRQTPAWLKQ